MDSNFCLFELEVECLKKVARESQRSLEIGVGSGRFAEALGIKFGLDSSRDLLKMAEKRGIIGILGKAERLPFKDESFEFAYMIFSLCFFEDPLIALKEAYRVLKSDGRLILGVIPSESPWAKYYQEKAKKVIKFILRPDSTPPMS